MHTSMMMYVRTREKEVPESVDQWLSKWQPKISYLRKRRGKSVASRASHALDELEFLLARTVENQVTE
jgi:hypothetical protein